MILADNYGLSNFIGETTDGSRQLVLFDPHYPTRLNKPPTTIVTGSPGSGKSFLLMSLMAQASIMNKLSFVIDPKGDALLLAKLQEKGIIRNVRFWNLFEDSKNKIIARENEGMLDPFRITDNPAVNASKVRDVLRILVPGLSYETLNIINPIIQDIAKLPDPSMAKFLLKLSKTGNKEVQGVWSELKPALDLPIGALLHSKTLKSGKFNIIETDGTVVANLLGIELPEAVVDPKDYTDANKISIAIMDLLCMLVMNTMKDLDSSVLKTIFIDEAWVIASNDKGAKMIESTALLGRSKNMALILASQSPRHFDKVDIANTVSTMFAFNAGAQSDADRLVTMMLLPKELRYDQVLLNLPNGTCLMQDCNKRAGVVKIIVPQTWEKAFNTKASTRKEYDKDEK